MNDTLNVHAQEVDSEGVFSDMYDEDFLEHIGTPDSGRYPHGSGEHPHQHCGDFVSRVQDLKRDGLSETYIAKQMGITTTELRAQYTIAKNEQRSFEVSRAKKLREKGYSYQQIAEKMGYSSDSSVRSLLNSDAERRMNQAEKTASFLKEQVDRLGMVDVGSGVELNSRIGVSREKMNAALALLKEQGYETYSGRIPQATNPGKMTTVKVLCPPGAEHKDIYSFGNIHYIDDGRVYSHDGGDTFDTLKYPKSFDSKRMKIRYAEDGGVDKDGVIELRRGVEDISLGNSNYAQVRILVDGTHYLKGMAVYSDTLPEGVDLVFNTNKKRGTPALGEGNDTVLKHIKDDPDNPFGSLIKANGQSYYIDENGERQMRVINKRADEGDWGEWADKLPAQFLSKQNMPLIKRQLKLATDDKQAEFDEICELTNPTIKRVLLGTFAEDCDAAAVHLQAAALPRQKYQVLLPVPSLKDNEIYAPNYQNGEQVALVRFPHGGTFEIPILTVNNKNKEARRVIGENAADAVGITKNVADRLSGADFDGDTAMVIPTGGKTKIKSTPPLKGLEGFDPKLEYGGKPEGSFKPLKKQNEQREMGSVSNLITDMTLKGATEDEIACAVRHSMVVIDAVKHNLDYKQSERDNRIAYLKKKYQGHYENDISTPPGGVSKNTPPPSGRYHEGASTLISKAGADISVPKRVGAPHIDRETGEVRYNESGETYVDKNGKTMTRMQRSTRMAEVRDARELSSGTPQEEAYADYANKMKALANAARKEMLATPRLKYSASAKETYRAEYESLDAKERIARKNAPRERQAQAMTASVVNAKKLEYPDLTKAELKKISQRTLEQSRAKFGAKRTPVVITDREWEAIQAGAISDNKLLSILNNTDKDALRRRATPRAANELSPAKQSKLRAMASFGYDNAQIAKALGVSASTVSRYLQGREGEK